VWNPDVGRAGAVAATRNSDVGRAGAGAGRPGPGAVYAEPLIVSRDISVPGLEKSE
jgi:hypothetical protein